MGFLAKLKKMAIKATREAQRGRNLEDLKKLREWVASGPNRVARLEEDGVGLYWLAKLNGREYGQLKKFRDTREAVDFARKWMYINPT